MKLPYERLAIFTMGAMLATLILAPTDRHAPEHSTRSVDHTHPLPSPWRPAPAQTTGP